jgi:EAL domain-containing protein (putative c-di-GMP-specific phosphodiesterase class I)
VVAGLVQFAARTGCQVLAEGIETEAQRAMVTELGATLGQGYLLAEPAPIEAWSIDAKLAVAVKLVEPNRADSKPPTRRAGRMSSLPAGS